MLIYLFVKPSVISSNAYLLVIFCKILMISSNAYLFISFVEILMISSNAYLSDFCKSNFHDKLNCLSIHFANLL